MTEINNLELTGNSSVRLLIVDDNPRNLQVLGKLLQDQRFDIEFATNGLAAMEWVEQEEFDLMLLDINMPEMDGFEVCSKIRANRRWDNLPILFLSANSDRESILKGFELGGQDYITKPFDGRELVVRVKTQIGLKQARERLESMNTILEEQVAERTKELAEANAQLTILNEQLIQLDKSKSEFLNLISHEIRTPLNGILGPMQLLRGLPQSEELADLFEILDVSVDRLEQFAVNALVITRLKTLGELKDIRSWEVDKEIGRLVAGFIQESSGKKQLKVHLPDPTGEKHYILGDEGLLETAMKHVLGNAFSFASNNIWITVADNKFGKVITIKDDGDGFPEEVLTTGPVLFRPIGIYRDKSMGIGLPLTHMICQAHGGDVIISNAPGGGAVVTMTFPQ